MKKEALRGRAAFGDLIRAGHRLDGALVRCHVRIEAGGKAGLRVGFGVSSRMYGAVRRNRLRRLMREGFRRERGRLLAALERSRCSLSLVILFRPRRSVPVHRLRADEVHEDFSSLCTQITLQLEGNR